MSDGITLTQYFKPKTKHVFIPTTKKNDVYTSSYSNKENIPIEYEPEKIMDPNLKKLKEFDICPTYGPSSGINKAISITK